jgi:ATP-dependent protease HslVU (ClpYQ) peptidase subunit
MSIIVAISDGKRVCMASDSQVGSGGNKMPTKTPKIYRRGDYLFGVVGSMITGHFLADHVIEADNILSAAENYGSELRQWASERNYLQSEDGLQVVACSTLIAHKSRIVLVDGTGSAVEPEFDWWAIGSGELAARGAIWALTCIPDMDSEEKARMAVEAACKLEEGCGGMARVEWT